MVEVKFKCNNCDHMYKFNVEGLRNSVGDICPICGELNMITISVERK